MSEATIEIVDGEQRITCGPYMFRKGGLYKNWFHLREFKAEDMDELYAVLHARNMAQHYDADIMKRLERAVQVVRNEQYKSANETQDCTKE